MDIQEVSGSPESIRKSPDRYNSLSYSLSSGPFVSRNQPVGVSRPPLPSRNVGNYLLYDPLQENVLRAANAHSGEELVCKVIPVSRYREVLCSYYCLPPHPNIIEMRDVVVGDAHAYLFFPRSYGNLGVMLQARRLPEDTARYLFRQLVSAVAHCHNNGLVLRDLKLNKFVFKNKERTLLMLESLDDAVIMQEGNTSPYYSPGHGDISGSLWVCAPATDVWSLGVMLHTLLLGCYPVGAGLTQEGALLTSQARCLIRSALHSNPNLRLSASELLTHPWMSTHAQAYTQAHTPDQTVPT
ncbi:tribbles homolog 2-like [Oncorhynchus tshawytscha]|uniref:tribbles homolog 2-like n=1 Tax=Oncorhynchus tshawytscha TaxID=74940 RepID=UPI001C3DB52B|nr:tribbles homolog 2-like [Oncorhynchus tshawytscha]